jgi:hypothetical protein
MGRKRKLSECHWSEVSADLYCPSCRRKGPANQCTGPRPVVPTSQAQDPIQPPTPATPNKSPCATCGQPSLLAQCARCMMCNMHENSTPWETMTPSEPSARRERRRPEAPPSIVTAAGRSVKPRQVFQHSPGQVPLVRRLLQVVD